MLTTYIFAGSPIIDLELVIVPSRNLSQGQMRKGTKTMPHEKFKPKQYDYDVALVLLDEELTYENTVSFLELSSYWAHSDDPVHLFGWERSEAGSQFMKLRQIQTRIACRSWGKDLAQPGAWDNIDLFTDGVLFVKDVMMNKSMCHGDTGSPLVVGNKLIGVASFGIDYNCKGLNAFSSIRRHTRWIKKNTLLLEGQNGKKGRGMMLTESMINIKEESLLVRKDFRMTKSSDISSRQPRIRNGTRIVSPEKFPFLVGIAYFKSNDPSKFIKPGCTGSILRIVDLSKFTEVGATYQAIEVANYSIHPKLEETKKMVYDIGVLRLFSPFKFNAQVTPICQLTRSYPKTGTTFCVAGWGKLQDETTPSYPSWTNVTVMNVPREYEVSNEGLGIYSDTFAKPSPCHGDSGAPYFIKDHEVIGIDSLKRPLPGTDIKSCHNNGSIGLSVSGHSKFIFDAMNELEEQISIEEQN